MAEGTNKAKLVYVVRAMQNPADRTKTIYTPQIAERAETLSIDTVVDRAIDRGRILGMKPAPAKAVAEGVCDQVYQELLEGYGVSFGRYFDLRLYLDGTVDGPGGQLTDANKVNVRIKPGVAFRVNRENFSWSNAADEKCAVVDYVMSSTGTRGEIAKNNPFDIEGRNFGTARSAIKVSLAWTEGDEAKTAEATVTGVGENRISCGFPQAMAQTAVGTEIKVSVIKTVDGADYTATCRQTTVLAADPS